MTEHTRIFVTGGTGSLGQSLLDEWRKLPWPNTELLILSRDPEKFLERHPEFHELPGVQFLAGDIRDFSFPAGRFDAVLHAGSPVSHRLEQENPGELRAIILGGMQRVIEFARLKEVKKLLFTSSGAVYGSQEVDFVDEEASLCPVTAYGQAKLEAEEMLLASGVPAVVARCFAFIGTRLPLDQHFAAGNFLRDALAGNPIVIQGDGRPLRSYLYAPDLIRQLRLLLEKGVPGRIYNVGSERAVSIAELARLAARLRTPPLPVQILGAPAPGPAPRYLPSLRRIREELAPPPEIPLEIALEETFRSLKSTGNGCILSG